MTIGERLRLERERLGFSQPAFAALVGASKKTQGRWEQGVSSPAAVDLVQWVEAGLDPLFVLVGRRSVAALGASAEDLAQFNELVDVFGALSDDRRSAGLGVLQAFLLADINAGTARGVRRRRPEDAGPASDTPYRPRPGAGDQRPSVHDEIGSYSTPQAKPSEAA